MIRVFSQILRNAKMRTNDDIFLVRQMNEPPLQTKMERMHEHAYKTLYYIADVPDSPDGHAIRRSGVVKCFGCGGIINEIHSI